MTDQEITAARGAMSQLIHRGECAILGLCDSGGFVWPELVEAIGSTRDALMPLGSCKANALLDEIESLSQRIRQHKADHTSALDELQQASGTLYVGPIMLRYYVSLRVGDHVADYEEQLKRRGQLVGTSPEDDADTIIDKVTRHLSSLCR